MYDWYFFFYNIWIWIYLTFQVLDLITFSMIMNYSRNPPPILYNIIISLYSMFFQFSLKIKPSIFPKCLSRFCTCQYIYYIVVLRFDINMGKSSRKWITHYSSSHDILLVGEGNFSFSACLASAFGTATYVVATSLDSEGTLFLNNILPRLLKNHHFDRCYVAVAVSLP